MAAENKTFPVSEWNPSEVPLVRVTDPVGYLFGEGTRRATDELPKIKSSFEGAQTALKLANSSTTAEELLNALLDNKTVPDTVSLYQAPLTPNATDIFLAPMLQMFIIPQLGDFGIVSDKDAWSGGGSTYGQGIGNKKLLELLNDREAVGQITVIESVDNPPIIDHQIPTPFEGIVLHLGIRQDRLEADDKHLDTEYFKASISAKAYADKLSS